MKVKYMTFQNSCSFCALANMLAELGADTIDRKIALEAGLPYIFRYEERTDSFLTGTMLQSPADYNRAMKQHGFFFADNLVQKENVVSFLAAYQPCMIGLAAEHGKHAMVFTRIADDKYCFLNPHRENDGQPDYVFLSKSDILARVDKESYIGYLEPLKEYFDIDETSASAVSADTLLSETLTVLDQYKERMTEFCQNLPSPAGILAIRDSLLRPIALEMPVMMGLIGENALQSKLLLFQKQIFSLFQSDGGKDINEPDLALLYEILEDYKRVVVEEQTLVA